MIDIAMIGTFVVVRRTNPSYVEVIILKDPLPSSNTQTFGV